MKAVHVLTARDRVALANAARTLGRIVGELDPTTPNGARPRRRRKPATPKTPRRRGSLRDVPDPA